MKIYNYNPKTFEYMNQEEADVSPLEPGVFLIPANATSKKPPKVSESEVAVWDGRKWVKKNIDGFDLEGVKTQLLGYNTSFLYSEKIKSFTWKDKNIILNLELRMDLSDAQRSFSRDKNITVLINLGQEYYDISYEEYCSLEDALMAHKKLCKEEKDSMIEKIKKLSNKKEVDDFIKSLNL